MSATDNADGTITLSWTLPADRYDRNEIVIRRAAGSTAPASVTDGDAVTSGSLVSSYTDTPGSDGTYSYSVFVGYDEDGDGQSDRYSDAEKVTASVTGTPPDTFLGADLLWWHDFSDSSTITLDGSDITSIVNKQNPGDTAEALRGYGGIPAMTLSAAKINGLDAGASDSLDLLRASNTTGLPDDGAAIAAYMVIQQDSLPGSVFYQLGTSTTFVRLQVQSDGSVLCRVYSGGSPLASFSSSAGVITAGQAAFVSFEQAASDDRKVYVDGALVASDTTDLPSPDNSSGVCVVGGYYDGTSTPALPFTDGFYGEHWITNGPLSAAKLADLESYVSGKWGVTFA